MMMKYQVDGGLYGQKFIGDGADRICQCPFPDDARGKIYGFWSILLHLLDSWQLPSR
jgi:hypothetical protein